MDVNARIDVSALRTFLEACLDTQRAVYTVVAIIGSTEEGSVDPLDDILALRDRMWEISPTIIRYDTLESTSTDVALTGLKALINGTANAKVTGEPLKKPIENFYQTDPISRA